ncbi:MAG: hypothetical protein ABI024_16965 [Vicinamibacterales bacterium]
MGNVPKLTGTVAGYPEYEGWVLITKDKRLPGLPQTLADRLDEEAAKRDKALAEAKRRPHTVHLQQLRRAGRGGTQNVALN